jgi:hypothetical protein
MDEKNHQMTHRRMVARRENPEESWAKYQFASHTFPETGNISETAGN